MNRTVWAVQSQAWLPAVHLGTSHPPLTNPSAYPVWVVGKVGRPLNLWLLGPLGNVMECESDELSRSPIFKQNKETWAPKSSYQIQYCTRLLAGCLSLRRIYVQLVMRHVLTSTCQMAAAFLSRDSVATQQWRSSWSLRIGHLSLLSNCVRIPYTCGKVSNLKNLHRSHPKPWFRIHLMRGSPNAKNNYRMGSLSSIGVIKKIIFRVIIYIYIISSVYHAGWIEMIHSPENHIIQPLGDPRSIHISCKSSFQNSVTTGSVMIKVYRIHPNTYNMLQSLMTIYDDNCIPMILSTTSCCPISLMVCIPVIILISYYCHSTISLYPVLYIFYIFLLSQLMGKVCWPRQLPGACRTWSWARRPSASASAGNRPGRCHTSDLERAVSITAG